MKIRFSFKLTALIVLLVIPLIIGVASTGYTGGPQPKPGKEGGAELVGKAVDGVLNSVVVEHRVVQYIVLNCRDADLVLGPAVGVYSTEDNLGSITAECSGEEEELCIEGFIFGDLFSPDNDPEPDLLDCFPEADGFFYNDLIITRVKNFINTGKSISAEVTLKAGQE
jgi:hypothetical protein